MTEEAPGGATIVYEDPEDGTVEVTVRNDQIAYGQDHWSIKTGEDDNGRDTVARIPAARVHRVEQTVESFEDDVATLTGQVQSVADDLTGLLPFGGGRRRSRRRRESEEPVEIDVSEEAPE